MENAGELIIRLMEAIKNLEPEDQDSSSKVASYLYIPDSRLSAYLLKLKKYLELASPSERQRREAGNLLEQIAALAFWGLQGISSMKSFRSAGPQYDLLISGDDYQWPLLQKLLYMNGEQRDILVEAKCTKDKVGDPQFARLCNLMEVNLFKTVGIGIFFTLKGATGFPDATSVARQKKLGEARLRQVIFHARTGKSVVVLEAKDIFSLNRPASLIQILIRKIRDLEQLSGLNTQDIFDSPKIEFDVPSHLNFLCER